MAPIGLPLMVISPFTNTVAKAVAGLPASAVGALVKLVPAAFQLPKRILSVPAPGRLPAVTVGEDNDCGLASWSTSSVNEVASAVLVAVTVAALRLDDDALRAVQAVACAIRLATSVRLATCDCTLPKSEIWVVSLLALLARPASGARSRATSLLTIVASAPLPLMPTDEMVAMCALLCVPP